MLRKCFSLETGPNPRIPRIFADKLARHLCRDPALRDLVALASRRPALSATADAVRRGDPAGEHRGDRDASGTTFFRAVTHARRSDHAETMKRARARLARPLYRRRLAQCHLLKARLGFSREAANESSPALQGRVLAGRTISREATAEVGFSPSLRDGLP